MKKSSVCAVPGGWKKSHPGGRKCFFLPLLRKNDLIFKSQNEKEKKYLYENTDYNILCLVTLEKKCVYEK